MNAYLTDYFEEDIVRDALNGCCHDFAVALHRRTGWPIAMFWCVKPDDDAKIPVHLVCIAPDGRVVDAEGANPKERFQDIHSATHARRCGPVALEIIGNEAAWEKMVEENEDLFFSMALRRHKIEAAERVISRSSAFLELVSSLITQADKEKKTDDEILGMLDHLAFKRRTALFEADFKKLVLAWFRENTEKDEPYALISAGHLWRSAISHGVIETYQEYIGDRDMLRAFAHALNA